MASDVRLDRLQRWMQAVVAHPGSPEQAIASRGAAREIPASRLGDVILPSRTLAPIDRVGIYHGMYLLRMNDALVSDYPALSHFLGDRGFFELVRAYVQKHPSRSYSLNRLGDHLPEYLRRAPGVTRRGFCVDLARLECSVAQAFDAEETPALSAEAIAALAEDAWEDARLQTVAGFRLLALRYPVNAYLQSVRDGRHDHPSTRRKDGWVVVYRKDYAVWRLELDRLGHELLSDLAGGLPLGKAVARAMRNSRRGATEEALFRWFRLWVSCGLFRGVETG
jgi:putative DNA-binding protein